MPNYTSYPSIGPTSSVTVNAKGAYTLIVAATPYASSRIYLFMRNSSLPSRLMLVDVATGAPGSEVVIIADIPLQGDVESHGGGFAAISVDIPVGTRLSCRVQSGVGSSQGCQLGFMLEDRALGSLANPVTYGTVAGSSKGTIIDPGGTVSTKGAYVQLTASTTANITTVAIFVTPGNLGQAITAYSDWWVDIATGVPGSEVVVIPNIPFACNATVDGQRTPAVVFPITIPAGSQISARCQSNRNTVNERLLAITIIGMQDPATSGSGGPSSFGYIG